MGKQQAVRLGSWKGIRFGGTKEPVELYNLDADISENHNVAKGHPDIVAKIKVIMETARANSEFNRFWPLPEYRQSQIKWDKVIFDQLENGIR
jgi:arylsulfatase